MKTFKVVVYWMESAVCEVEADSLEEAKKMIHDDPGKYAPEHGDYVDDSFRVDHDCTEDMNEEDD
jgi:hypothetical protein